MDLYRFYYVLIVVLNKRLLKIFKILQGYCNILFFILIWLCRRDIKRLYGYKERRYLRNEKNHEKQRDYAALKKYAYLSIGSC